MKIKVESEKIVKAVKKLEGIEIVIENAADAKEAILLFLGKAALLDPEKRKKLKDLQVTAFQRYETSAVDYKMVFLLEFIFDESVPADAKVAVIKEFQGFFSKV